MHRRILGAADLSYLEGGFVFELPRCFVIVQLYWFFFR
jgi:hypothetical protein